MYGKAVGLLEKSINLRSPSSFGNFVFSVFRSCQICRALAYIHGGIGVCHRDIKPQNLLVCTRIFLCFSSLFYCHGMIDVFTTTIC